MAQTLNSEIIEVNETARPEMLGAVADDGGAQTDETQEANNSTADDMTLLPASPAAGDAYYFGGFGEFNTLTLNISTAGAGTWSIVWEYWDGAAWSALSGVTDNTNGFTTGGVNDVTFTEPSNWETTTVTTIDAYWIRARVDTFTGITTQPLGQESSVTGVRSLVAKTRGSISMGPNTDVAESGNHNSIHQDKQAVSEGWEVSFEKQLISTLGGLETLGLYDSTNQRLLGHSGEAPLTPPDSIEIVCKDMSGTVDSKYLLRGALIILDDATIEDEDFSIVSLTSHLNYRPEKTA